MHEAPWVVIGGGVAGLTAGLSLAAAGRPVMLFEAADRLGGCCCTMGWADRVFEPGASMILGVGMLRETLGPLGVKLDAMLGPLQPAVRVMWPGGERLDLLTGQGAAGTSPTLARDAEGLAAFVTYWSAVARRLPAVLTQWQRQGITAAPQLLPLLPSLLKPYRTAVRKCIRDPRLRQALEGFCPFYAGLPARVAPAVFAILPALAIQEGCYEVVGGIQRLPEHLAARLREAGGQIHVGERVTRMVTSGPVVREVQTTHRVLRVAGVVAAVDLSITLGCLPRTMRLALARTRAAVLRRSVSCCSLIGAEQGVADIAPITWVLPGSGDQADATAAGSRRPAAMWPLAAVTAGPGEPGGRCVRLGGAVEVRPGGSLVSLADRDLKAELLSMAVGAGLDLDLVDMTFWAPQDYETRLGLPAGAAFGFAGSRSQLGPARYGPKTPLRNLTVAGQSCFPGFGIPLAALSGRLAAATMLGPGMDD
jgi:phytoene dehydrogenase-like protein